MLTDKYRMDYNRNTAILLIIFNRPDTTQKVFGQVKKVKPSRLYIAADGPGKEGDYKLSMQTRSIISGVDWNCEIFKLYQTVNLGCDAHCYKAISWFFEKEPEGIILEDDCVPSISFFSFCSTLLEKYRYDQRIGHIAGGNYQFGKKRGDGTYYFSNLTHVGGWAGWRRVWKDVVTSADNYSLFERLGYLSHLPSHAFFRSHWSKYFGLANSRPEFCWDFKYAYTNLIHHHLSIIPNYNLVSNIGCANKPTHYIENYPFADIKKEEIDDMKHPTFLCPDIEADLYSQAIEYNFVPKPLHLQEECIYLKERLHAALRESPVQREIPRIIHQIYTDDEHIPDFLLKISQSWKEMNPDWSYRFWGKKDIDCFLQTYYPELITPYNELAYDVQRWDSIRYLILYKIGGLYVDMDYECTENITPVLCGIECAMGMEPEGHAIRNRTPYIVGNAFMATVPAHPYFKELIESIFTENKIANKGMLSPELGVLHTTGPFLTTRIYEHSENQENVTLVPAGLIAPLTREEVQALINNDVSEDMEMKIEKSFAIHYFLGSWYK